ncbi:septal ring factor EnvC (AmiA/AmiB activator) [Chitinophaga skermanii]|uniref:Septal ring factor EnvC (AmiA/AmiB activator) n=1 Tax=Chitinophaga skermanii TaxID=331697 RepID=A0A327R4B9_9BACT|nr:peptidoglycan DD-metalloendopeptidase family protein [Chitinophaga skermanii]RAJ10614.1 septal ring factor EnvC (AmiA/AmiB activator) [Chitinophaga skermanii]
MRVQFNKFFTILVVVMLGVMPIALQAQNQPSREELERRKRELQKEIDEANEALKETKKSSKESLGQLRVLRNKIELRSKLINNINSEINFINGDINSAYRDVKTLEKDLDTLKQQYAQLVVYAYKNRSSYAMLNFVFSANSFNDAVKRYEYLRQYREYRRRQAGTIVETQNALKTKINNLESQKVKRSTVLKSEQEERSTLEKDKQEKDEVFNKLKSREKELTTDLTKKIKDAQKVQTAIRAVIRKEIEDARKKAEAEELARKKAAAAEAERKRIAAAEEARRVAAAKAAAANAAKEAAANNNNHTVVKEATAQKPPEPKVEQPKPQEKDPEDTKPARAVNVLEATPEAAALGESFEANKGKLPWPMASGIITGYFGPQKHPVIETITINHQGLIFSTPKNEPVRTIFDGEVRKIFAADGSGYVVIIKHGQYFTNYVHVQSLRVKSGDMVKTGQVIGTASTNEEDNRGEFELQIWKSVQLQNPILWLKRK